jgi:hypothetical protein
MALRTLHHHRSVWTQFTWDSGAPPPCRGRWSASASRGPRAPRPSRTWTPPRPRRPPPRRKSAKRCRLNNSCRHPKCRPSRCRSNRRPLPKSALRQVRSLPRRCPVTPERHHRRRSPTSHRRHNHRVTRPKSPLRRPRSRRPVRRPPGHPVRRPPDARPRRPDRPRTTPRAWGRGSVRLTPRLAARDHRHGTHRDRHPHVDEVEHHHGARRHRPERARCRMC